MHLPQFVGSLLRLRGVEWSNDSSIRKRKESGKKQSNANRGNVPITRAGTEESHKALSRQPVRWLRSQQKLKSLSPKALAVQHTEARLRRRSFCNTHRHTATQLSLVLAAAFTAAERKNGSPGQTTYICFKIHASQHSAIKSGLFTVFICRNTPRLPSLSTLRHHMTTRDGISLVASWFKPSPHVPSASGCFMRVYGKSY